jgi:hypothetical protein
MQALLDYVETTGNKLPSATLDYLEASYNLTSVHNSEIRFKWTKLCLLCGRAAILKHAANFAVSQGRMKFVRPLYRALMETEIPGAAELAIGTFAANKNMYHPICRKMVANDMERAWAARQASRPTAAAAATIEAAAPPAGAMGSFIAGVGFGAVFMTVLGIVLAKQKN